MKDGFPVYTWHGKEYTLPYWLPERKRGRFTISIEFEHPPKKLPIVGMRNALFMGLKPAQLLLTRPLGIHYLREEGVGTWMSSMPQEVEQHTRQLARLKGRVLVGGLGLGLGPALLQAREDVREIVVVEKSYAVLELISMKLPKVKTRFVRADLFEYLHDCKETFDSAFYDVWQGTGERVLTEFTLPLRRKSLGILAQDQIECWNEDEMIGQIETNLQTTIMAMHLPEWPSRLKITEEFFNRCKEAVGMPWFFERWIRQQKPTQAQAQGRIKEFCAALKDPVQLDKWIDNKA